MKIAPVRVFSCKHPLSRILSKGAGMVRSANKSVTKREHEASKSRTRKFQHFAYHSLETSNMKKKIAKTYQKRIKT